MAMLDHAASASAAVEQSMRSVMSSSSLCPTDTSRNRLSSAEEIRADVTGCVAQCLFSFAMPTVGKGLSTCCITSHVQIPGKYV